MKHIPFQSNKIQKRPLRNESIHKLAPKIDKENDSEINHDPLKDLAERLAKKFVEKLAEFNGNALKNNLEAVLPKDIRQLHGGLNAKRIKMINNQISETKSKRAKCESELKRLKEDLGKVNDKINELLKPFRDTSH